MQENRNQLREDSIAFAIAVSDACDNIKGCSVFTNQLLRSSSSVGANIHEAQYAQSRADFISKLEIALKESSKRSIGWNYCAESINYQKSNIKPCEISADLFAAD